jgi:hypothetical protein
MAIEIANPFQAKFGHPAALRRFTVYLEPAQQKRGKQASKESCDNPMPTMRPIKHHTAPYAKQKPSLAQQKG